LGKKWTSAERGLLAGGLCRHGSAIPAPALGIGSPALLIIRPVLLALLAAAGSVARVARGEAKNLTAAPARSVISSCPFHLETVAKLLILLKCLSAILSKRALTSLNNQADFDSAIRRFDPSRPSQRSSCWNSLYKQLYSRQIFGGVWK